jgi:hypothetical protein
MSRPKKNCTIEKERKFFEIEIKTFFEIEIRTKLYLFYQCVPFHCIHPKLGGMKNGKNGWYWME